MILFFGCFQYGRFVATCEGPAWTSQHSELHENHFKDDLKAISMMIWHFQRNKKIREIRKKMWEIMLPLDGPICAVLCWFWCPHSEKHPKYSGMISVYDFHWPRTSSSCLCAFPETSGKLDNISKILKPPLQHDSILVVFWHAMALALQTRRRNFCDHWYISKNLDSLDGRIDSWIRANPPILANRFRVPKLRLRNWTFGGLEFLNHRFEAIRTNRSHTTEIVFFFLRIESRELPRFALRIAGPSKFDSGWGNRQEKLESSGDSPAIHIWFCALWLVRLESPVSVAAVHAWRNKSQPRMSYFQ